jgi:chromosome segregation ATPase
MTEEEIQQLLKENAELKDQCKQQQQRIQELEGLLLSALLRIEELERRLAKDSHNSSLPPREIMAHASRWDNGRRARSPREDNRATPDTRCKRWSIPMK